MPTTPNRVLPYPVASDTADVPRDIKALADRLDLFGGAAGSLPAAPTDGQECFYVADATSRIVWQLRYNAGSSSPYKWEFVGGSPLLAEHIGDSAPFTGAVYAQTTPAVAVTVPVAGDYLIAHSAVLYNDTAGSTTYQSVKLSAAVPADADGFQAVSPTGNFTYSGATVPLRRTITPSGTVVSLWGRCAGGNGWQRFRRLTVTPIRIG